MATRKEIIRLKEALRLPKHAQSLEVCAVNKDNVLYLINLLGEDKQRLNSNLVPLTLNMK